ncbi:S-adenosyl-L-methionine-dependent methyltransferase [Basidiobolus meristosporus CBS 931.73]|uniref:S-adenosyl-L-methionine-dependent methyltransferase n=1 Tax=Basidiobolus meristosporus CBS 931.73 TaxID=1314790 RepID=A0A1Y1YHC6_9FUNG|nr:S-adenosyl-L-methionine-dependent methyltransferase [Basidiobolus meristosporus CBS 931.73]|eukprot:ORX97126.1 S-adenosyl-L-methionine-dependent methyltransferase [Basidiobolus meristosporus CBS 931.73]
MDEQNIVYRCWTVTKEEANSRASVFVRAKVPDIVTSRLAVHRSFKRGEVLVNNEKVLPPRILLEGDVVEFKFNTYEARKAKNSTPIEVVYEDADVCVAWKVPGMNITSFLEALPFSMSDCAGFHTDLKPKSLYELEKATVGWVAVAKTIEAQNSLEAKLKSGLVRRTYRAVVHGKIECEVGENFPIDSKVADFESCTHVSFCRSNSAGYLSTVDICSVGVSGGATLRKLFEQLDHPVVGNNSYTKQLKTSRDKGMFLSLLALEFPHPVSGEPMRFFREEPNKFEALRQREVRFFEKRKLQYIEELQKNNVDVVEYDPGTEMPVAYLLGYKEFCGLRFHVTPATLIPRQSTEALVAAAVEIAESMKDRETPIKILDLGTGSGCILLSCMKKIADSTGCGVDISPEALEVAKKNAESLDMVDRVNFVTGDFSKLDEIEELKQSFDIVLCNPPYIPEDKARKLDFGVSEFEPHEALFCGETSLTSYQMLHASVREKIISANGYLVLEAGSGTADQVKDVFNDWDFIKFHKDHHDINRCLVFQCTNTHTS